MTNWHVLYQPGTEDPGNVYATNVDFVATDTVYDWYWSHNMIDEPWVRKHMYHEIPVVGDPVYMYNWGFWDKWLKDAEHNLSTLRVLPHLYAQVSSVGFELPIAICMRPEMQKWGHSRWRAVAELLDWKWPLPAVWQCPKDQTVTTGIKVSSAEELANRCGTEVLFTFDCYNNINWIDHPPGSSRAWSRIARTVNEKLDQSIIDISRSSASNKDKVQAICLTKV
jgi:hypothetical protein